ncbi:unnamed protein product [Gadus morhua 'NCC']
MATEIDHLVQDLTEGGGRPPQRSPDTVRASILRALARLESQDGNEWARVPTESETIAALEALSRTTRGGHGPTRLMGRKMPTRRWRPTGREAAGSQTFNYLRLQELYRRNAAKVSRLVLDGDLDGPCPIKVADVASHFKEKWGSRDGFQGFGGVDIQMVGVEHVRYLGIDFSPR